MSFLGIGSLSTFCKKAETDTKQHSFLPLDAKMDIIYSKQDVQVGEELLLLCKGESLLFHLMTNETCPCE